MSISNLMEASEHCQTCFVKFEAAFFNENGENVAPHPVNIQENEEVKKIFKKYIDDRPTEDIEGFPQSLCSQCSQTLLSFDSFCKQAQENVQKLHDLLTEQVSTSKEDEMAQTANEYETEDTAWNGEEQLIVSDSESSLSDFSDIHLRESKTSKIISDCETKNVTLGIEEKLQSNNDSNEPKENKSKFQYECSHCQISFKDIKQLNLHVQAKHEDSKKPYQCNECGKSFSVSSTLERHMDDVHVNKPRYRKRIRKRPERPYKCTEPDCNKSYITEGGLDKHKTQHKPKTYKAYICDQCGAIYPQLGSLAAHKKAKHITPEEKAERDRNRKVYPCTQCEKTYFSPYALRNHTKETHTDYKPFQCAVCEKRFSLECLLKAHLRFHADVYKQTCEMCGKQFSRKTVLEEHIRAVHLKLRPFKCKYCNDSFACPKTLRHHEYIHTGEKPYVCKVCGIAYRQRSCLRNHRKTHEETNI